MACLIVLLALLVVSQNAAADPATTALILTEVFSLTSIAAELVYLTMAVAYVSAFAAYSNYERRKADQARRDSMRDRTMMIRTAEAPHNVIYGRARVSGPIAYAVTSGSESQFLHLVVVLASHELDAIEEVWLNDESLGTLNASGYVTTGSYLKSAPTPEAEVFTLPAGGACVLSKTPISVQSVGHAPDEEYQAFVALPFTVSGSTVTVTGSVGLVVTITYFSQQAGIALVRAKKFLGIAAGERDTDLETASSGAWTSAHVGKSVARLHLTFQYDRDAFPSGIPNVSAVVRGKKLYDPRSTTTTWSSNSALAVRDHLISARGFNAASAEIDDAAVIVAANLCDELVNWDATHTHARYTCDGVFTTDQAKRDILNDLLTTMMGAAVYSGGLWLIRAGAYVTPTLDLTDSDLADGDIAVQSHVGRRELFNAVRGQFVDPAQKHVVVDFPPYASSTYATEDGGEMLYTDIELPFTNDAYRAQRIAKLMLYRARQATAITATWKLPAYALQPTDTCRLTIGRYGWTNKVFRVISREYTHPHQVKLVLQEEASAIYAWNYSEAVVPDAAPNTDLPDPRTVGVIAGLSAASGASIFTRLSDGSVAPLARVTWTLPNDAAIVQGGDVKMIWKRAVDTVWHSDTVSGSVTQYDIKTSPNEVINIGARTINSSGARGDYAYLTHTVSSAALSNAANSLQGSSSNLVRNAGLRYSSFPWLRYNGDASQAGSWGFVQNPGSHPNSPAPFGSVMFYTTSATSSSFTYSANVLTYVDLQECAPVIAGRRYEIQIRAKTLNGTSKLALRWLNSAGTIISTVEPAGGAIASANQSYSTSSQALASFDLLWGFATAPTGAVGAILVVFHARTTSVAHSAHFLAMPYFGEASASQMQPSAWAEGENAVAGDLIASAAATEVATLSIPSISWAAGSNNLNGPWTTEPTVTWVNDTGAEVDVVATLQTTVQTYLGSLNDPSYCDAFLILRADTDSGPSNYYTAPTARTKEAFSPDLFGAGTTTIVGRLPVPAGYTANCILRINRYNQTSASPVNYAAVNIAPSIMRVEVVKK
jgi:hypothetical protein